MARKKTREELEREIASLRAFEEAFYALRGTTADGREVTFASGEGESQRSISVVGLARAAGGVVIMFDGQPCAPRFLDDVCRDLERFGHIDPYGRDVASKARRGQKEAVEALCAVAGRPHVAIDDRIWTERVRGLATAAYWHLVRARAYVMGPEVREETNEARRALAWALRVHFGVAVDANDDPSGNGGAPKVSA